MARHYATRDFFRQMPNPLLARYFHARGVFDDLDIAALPEPQPDALWAAWLTLDDPQRHAMDATFQDIAALSGEKGCRAILDDAAWYFATDPAAHAAFVEQLASLAHHGARAMTTFLDHPACWRRAARFCYAEALPAWRKRTHLPHVPAAVDEASLEALAAGLSAYFRHTEGRGTHCVVEPVRRGTLDYFFAYPEDYAQHSVEWVDGQFGQRPHHPAFEVIYVYSQADGTLDVNIRGARTAVEPLQGLFAATILKQPALPPDPTDDRVYDLNALREPGFEFVYDSGSGIQDVAVTALRLASRVTTGDRLTLEADAVGHPTAVYDLLARLGSAVPLHLYRVTQVELAASVITDDQPAATAGDDSPHPSQRVLPALRRPRPHPARHAARLRDRAKSARRRGGPGGMTPREALLDLVARVGARDGAAVRISETDVRQWPAEAVSALKAHRLLVRARPARTVVCPGCEADCVMPVQTIPAGPREAARFIVCDKRSDINRVALTTAHVDQWKCDGEALARFVVEQLGLRRSRHRADASEMRPLGLAAGDTRHQMLGLRTRGDVTLVVADTAVALVDLIDFDHGTYVLDTAAIRHLVDAATTADPRYTPSTTRREARTLDSQARYARWQTAYRALKQRRPQMSDVWYARQIAKQTVAAGCQADTIRRHMTGRPGAVTRGG